MANARPQGFNDRIIEDFRAHAGQPSWYHNLRAHPEVTVELGPDTFRARAAVADDAERRRLYDQHAAKMPAFADYERKTTRKIPVVVLELI